MIPTSSIPPASQTAPTPPPPPPQKPISKEKKNSFLNFKIFSNLKVVIVTVTIIIIIALSFLYYYYGVLSIPVSEFTGTTERTPPKTGAPEPQTPGIPQTPEASQLPEIPQQPQLPEGEYTKVTSYFPPAVLPTATKQGKCQLNSIAQPYRQDTWRCVAENKVYDPCFAIQEDKVVCQMNPLASDIFIIKLASPLLPKTAKDNWAWFLTFNDGTYCAPYTGRRPQVQGEEVYYGCKCHQETRQWLFWANLKRARSGQPEQRFCFYKTINGESAPLKKWKLKKFGNKRRFTDYGISRRNKKIKLFAKS